MSSNQALQNEIIAFDAPTAAYRTTDPNLAVRIDDTSTANTTYIGKATIGAESSAAVWQIAKLDTSSGLIKTWAGNAGFTQIWDNRTGLTYN